MHALAARIAQEALAALAAHDEVAFIEEALPLLTGANDGVRTTLSIPQLWSDPVLGLSGAGVDVLVYDQGQVDPGHADFAGRLVSGDASGVASHSWGNCCQNQRSDPVTATRRSATCIHSPT